MRVLVCGGRDYRDEEHIHNVLDGLSIQTLIHGAAPGADSIAVGWAVKRGIPTIGYHAMWKEFGKAAGPMRNQKMLDDGKPDLVVAFPGGRGTKDMVTRARSGRWPFVTIAPSQFKGGVGRGFTT